MTNLSQKLNQISWGHGKACAIAQDLSKEAERQPISSNVDYWRCISFAIREIASAVEIEEEQSYEREEREREEEQHG